MFFRETCPNFPRWHPGPCIKVFPIDPARFNAPSSYAMDTINKFNLAANRNMLRFDSLLVSTRKKLPSVSRDISMRKEINDVRNDGINWVVLLFLFFSFFLSFFLFFNTSSRVRLPMPLPVDQIKETLLSKEVDKNC